MLFVDATGSRGDDADHVVSGARAGATSAAHPPRRAQLGCPFCCTYEVDRLFVGSSGLDSCACRVCGAAWDEVVATGEVMGRSPRHSALLRQ